MDGSTNNKQQNWLPVFFGIAAASWMPHFSCHYYRLETGSSFVVGNLDFSILDSVLFMLFYLGLVVLNIIAISKRRIRFIAALSSGILHLALGIIHIFRLFTGFNFEVFGYQWSMGASIREILIVIPFGIICIAAAIKIKRDERLSAKSAGDFTDF